MESVLSGIHVYPNPAGVLTNNPPFPEQMFNLNNYMHLSPKDPENCFSDKLSLKTYCRGMGALGLPGDLSSQSRFVRAAFVKLLLHHLRKPSDHCRGYAPGGSGGDPVNSVSPCTKGADPVPELAPGRLKTFWETPGSEVP